jgi:hypothetical protein
MKTQRTWPYLSLVALMSLAGCSTSRQTAQTTGEMDDLYASSANAVVHEGSGQSAQPAERTTTTRDFSRQRTLRNTNPDYAANDDQRGYDPNQDEYYTELTTRKLKRGLSPDPGWTGGSYNDGFTDGYYAGLGNPSFNGLRWNPWGWGSGFSNGFSLGLGVGSAWGSPWGMNSWNRWGGGFYDPFWGGGFNSYAYSPWGWGGGFNSWGYDPYWGGGFNRWGNGWNNWGGGWNNWNRPVIVNNNTIITGADPYRNSRSYGARGTSSSNRYNDNFNNTARSTDTRNTGGRTAYGNGSPAYGGNSGSSSTPSSSDGYYARPRQNSRGGYYYENGGSSANGNSSRSSAPASTYSNPSNSGGYYSAPRQNSRGSYSPPSDNGGSYSSGNSSRTYSQPSYQAPTQQRSYESRSESRPSYQPQQSSQSYSQPSYSAPSSSGSSNSSGGGGYSGGGGGGSRGPR